MSRSWLSDSLRRGRWPLRGVLAALAVMACLEAAPSEAARVRSSSAIDSGRVSRISISEHGIVVEREGSRDTSMDWSDGSNRRDRRDRLRHRIRTSSGLLEVEDSGTGIVRIWSDALVPAGKVVDGDVVAVFGSVTVEGEVSGDVVAVLGSVHLKSGAKVEGDVVSIGGGLEQAEGVTVNGESVQLGFSPFTWGLPGISVLLVAVFAGWLVSMFVGWIFVLLFPTGMLRVATVVERRPAASFFLGLLSVPGFCVAVVLLCITVIGIPLGVLLPMIYALMGYLGQLAATCVLGARLARRSLANGLMMPLLVGTLFVAILLGAGTALMAAEGAARSASLFLTLSGGLLLLGLGTLGTGAFLLSRFGTRPADVVWRGHEAAPGMRAADPIPPPVAP
jgi:hypothetical protein